MAARPLFLGVVVAITAFGGPRESPQTVTIGVVPAVFDLGRDLGRTPTDQECYEAVEAQIDRLERSIGEHD